MKAVKKHIFLTVLAVIDIIVIVLLIRNIKPLFFLRFFVVEQPLVLLLRCFVMIAGIACCIAFNVYAIKRGWRASTILLLAATAVIFLTYGIFMDIMLPNGTASVTYGAENAGVYDPAAEEIVDESSLLQLNNYDADISDYFYQFGYAAQKPTLDLRMTASYQEGDFLQISQLIEDSFAQRSTADNEKKSTYWKTIDVHGSTGTVNVLLDPENDQVTIAIDYRCARTHRGRFVRK